MLYLGTWLVFEIITFRYSRKDAMHFLLTPLVGGALVEVVFWTILKYSGVFYFRVALLAIGVLIAYLIYVYPVVYGFRMREEFILECCWAVVTIACATVGVLISRLLVLLSHMKK